MIKQLLIEALERLATGFFVGLGFTTAALLILTVWLWPLQVHADDLRLYGGGYSHHLFSDDDYNESHDLAAVQYGPAVVGRFNNSFGRESYFAAYEWTWRPVQHLEAFLWAGGVRGYTSCKPGSSGDRSKVCAFGGGGLRWTQWRVEPVAVLVGEAGTLAAAVRF